jgi:hypothetical protein
MAKPIRTKQTMKTNLLVSGLHFFPDVKSNHHKKEIPVMASPLDKIFINPPMAALLPQGQR